jgi:hypothetical protein
MNLNPTKEGRIVDARLLVKIGVLFLSESAKLGNAVKKGPAGDRTKGLVECSSLECLVFCARLPFHADRVRVTAVGSILPAHKCDVYTPTW